MALIDDYNHFTWVYFLKRKYEALLTFKVFKQMIKNLTKKKKNAKRLTVGGEFMSRYFTTYCHEQAKAFKGS
jgi:hypothetical protein